MSLEFLVQILISLIGGMLVIITGWAAHSLNGLRDDIKELTTQVTEGARLLAVVVERVDGHEKRIEKLEEYGD